MIKPNAEVLQQARNRGEKIHVGSLMTIVSIKSYERMLANGLLRLALCFVAMQFVMSTISPRSSKI